MGETYSQAFPPKLKQNFNIFVPKIQSKSQNQMAAKARAFYKKHYLENAWPHKLNLLRMSFTVVILRNLLFDQLTSLRQLILSSSTSHLAITLQRENSTFHGKWFYLLNYNNIYQMTRIRKLKANKLIEEVLPILRFCCLPNIPFCFVVM